MSEGPTARITTLASLEEIAAMEQETFERARRINGWTAAAALHARVNREGVHNTPICASCTALAELAAGGCEDNLPVVVDWPCDTAKALGLR